jgi:hypothetical protein
MHQVLRKKKKGRFKMKNLNGYRIKWMLVGIVVAVVLGGGSAKSDIIMSEATCVDQVINNGTNTQECSFLQDGLKLYFSNVLPGGYGGIDLWVSTRETQDAPWQEPVNLVPFPLTEFRTYRSVCNYS